MSLISASVRLGQACLPPKNTVSTRGKSNFPGKELVRGVQVYPPECRAPSLYPLEWSFCTRDVQSPDPLECAEHVIWPALFL